MKKSENESRTPGSVWFREVAALVGIMGTLLLTAPGLSGQNTGTISGRILDAELGYVQYTRQWHRCGCPDAG